MLDHDIIFSSPKKRPWIGKIDSQEAFSSAFHCQISTTVCFHVALFIFLTWPCSVFHSFCSPSTSSTARDIARSLGNQSKHLSWKKTHIGPGHWYKLGAIYGPISSNNLRVDIALERMKVEKFNEKNWMTICLIWFKMSLEPWGTNETIFTMVIAIAYHQMTLTKSLN